MSVHHEKISPQMFSGNESVFSCIDHYSEEGSIHVENYIRKFQSPHITGGEQALSYQELIL